LQQAHADHRRLRLETVIRDALYNILAMREWRRPGPPDQTQKLKKGPV